MKTGPNVGVCHPILHNSSPRIDSVLLCRRAGFLHHLVRSLKFTSWAWVALLVLKEKKGCISVLFRNGVSQSRTSPREENVVQLRDRMWAVWVSYAKGFKISVPCEAAQSLQTWLENVRAAGSEAIFPGEEYRGLKICKRFKPRWAYCLFDRGVWFPPT